jgi:hypothetical protein
MRGCLPNSAGSSTGAEPKHDSKLVRAIGRWSLTALIGAVEDRPTCPVIDMFLVMKWITTAREKLAGEAPKPLFSPVALVHSCSGDLAMPESRSHF